MIPDDAYPLVGETVTMDCQLDRSKVRADVNASDLVFIPGNDIVSYIHGTRDWYAPGVQTVIDSDTLRLTLTDVTRDDNGHVSCKLKEDGTHIHVVQGSITAGGTVYTYHAKGTFRIPTGSFYISLFHKFAGSDINFYYM